MNKTNEEMRLEGMMDWAYSQYVNAENKKDKSKFANIFMAYYVSYKQPKLPIIQ